MNTLPYQNIIEMWNPSVEDVEEISDYLFRCRKVLFIWIYGEVELIPNYNSIFNERVVRPIYLGKTMDEALLVRDQILNLYVLEEELRELVYTPLNIRDIKVEVKINESA